MDLNRLDLKTFTDIASKVTPAAQMAIVCKLLEAVVARCSSNVKEWKTADNPQIVKMRERAQAELDLAQATLDALKGNTVDLKMTAGL